MKSGVRTIPTPRLLALSGFRFRLPVAFWTKVMVLLVLVLVLVTATVLVRAVPAANRSFRLGARMSWL